MKNRKQSLVKQLVEAKAVNNEDQFELIHEEIIEEIENLCCTKLLSNDDTNKERIIMLSEILNSYSKSLKQYAADLD